MPVYPRLILTGSTKYDHVIVQFYQMHGWQRMIQLIHESLHIVVGENIMK
jgi:hypothetical protein